MGDLGVLGEGQKVYFSEHGHVAYQISVHGGKSLEICDGVPSNLL